MSTKKEIEGQKSNFVNGIHDVDILTETTRELTVIKMINEITSKQVLAQKREAQRAWYIQRKQRIWNGTDNSYARKQHK